MCTAVALAGIQMLIARNLLGPGNFALVLNYGPASLAGCRGYSGGPLENVLQGLQSGAILMWSKLLRFLPGARERLLSRASSCRILVNSPVPCVAGY